MKKASKAELLEEIKNLKEANRVLVRGGLEFQRRFESAYKLMNRIQGLNDHTLWLELQEFLDQYEIINYPVYGLKVIPKR